MRAPRFWWTQRSIAGFVLAQLGHLYGRLSGKRMATQGYASALPVVCVGNLVAGGAGKTPTALMIATLLKAGGYKPIFLTRGYGGKIKGPCLVDPQRHTAIQVGDEAPLLARVAPTIVARDRVAGAEMARAYGNVIVMDDGLQNPSLRKDFSIAVIDSGQGIGNGRVIPAGPLRAPLDQQLKHVDVCLLIGEGQSGGAGFRNLIDKPVYRGRIVPNTADLDRLKGARVLAFAGIGRPEKFFETLRTIGAIVETTQSFPDHHIYARDELERLIAAAEAHRLTLITTAKDAIRIAAIAPELMARIGVLDVRLDCNDAMTLMGKLVACIEAKTARRT